MKPLVGGVRVRENMVKLPAWDPTFVWYAKGVAAMRARALKDPLSWRFQAAIHGYAKAEDPFPHPANALPTAAIRVRVASSHNAPSTPAANAASAVRPSAAAAS